MSLALESGVPARAASTGARWLVSRRQDLLWFIGSAGAGYLALLLLALGVPQQPIFLFWLIGVDGPHVFATMTRTHFDKVERRRLGWWVWVALPLACIGPVFTFAGHNALFLLLAVSWQHYHIAKQHLGFMMLWRARNGERDAREMKIDKRMVLATTVLPLLSFVAYTELPRSPIVTGAIGVAALGWLALAIQYVAIQVRHWKHGDVLNTPKLLLLAVLAPLYAWAFTSAALIGPEGILRAGIACGLFHSLQYHRLLWFHNTHRHTGPDAFERHGVAALLARNVLAYASVAIALNWFLSVAPSVLADSKLIASALWGFAFSHYVLDSKIWHVRSDPELASALGFAPRT